jgi:dipeptidyl aminopeptidase/acylaminoacyl peptidase
MNRSARLEQDLTAWLSETAMPSTPDYADEILDQTARIRQRPRWTFLGRWLPIPEVPWTTRVGARTALKAVTLLVVLGLLLAAVTAFVGSRRTLPPPFGLAGNGLLSSDIGGDIVVIDPGTGARRTIVAHKAVDHDAHWALDGTRLAFLREVGDRLSVVISDAHGRIIAVSQPFEAVDSDSVAWSPDGREIAVNGSGHEGSGIYLIDAATGVANILRVPYSGLEVYWRPPDGRQLLFRLDDAQGGGLGIASVADGSFVRLSTEPYDSSSLRPLGWTPDGRAVLFQQDDANPEQTVIVDVQTGAQTTLDVAYGHVSNDGTRVAGVDDLGRFCVAPISGGGCVVIRFPGLVQGTHGASVRWSPDDRWIAVSTSPVWLVDPTNERPPRQIADGGPGSWQRTLP